MASEKLNSIDDYESFLSATIEAWSPEQRLALAAAMAERWLGVYEAFSAAEKWGDPASLRRSLHAIWTQVRGRPLAPADQARYAQQLHDSTPHMDDFDAPEALAACAILSDALDCCGTADNTWAAVRAALSGFEAAVTDWAFEPEDQPRLWKRVAARKELKKQLKLVEQIGAIARFDDRAIEALRKGLTSPESVGEVSAKPKPAAPPGLTNQAAFEQYRRLLESHLKRPGTIPPSDSGYTFAMSIVAEWGCRYLHRLRTISGKDGRLADVPAQQALVARLRAKDAAEPTAPDWNPTVREVSGLCLSNPFGGYDVKSLLEPHGYGPSLRRLWAEAKRSGQSDADAWNSILAWARHRPAAWDVDDKRKKKGLAHATPALGEQLARKLTWTATDDPDHPWAAEVDGKRWQVRLNDFPDDFMYSLVIGGEAVGHFHDWPETWRRG